MTAPYALADADLLAECDASSSSTHSPGGQHRNKAESAVRLRHRPSGLVAQCEAHRDRADNRIEALRHLRLRLVLAHPGCADRAWLEPHRADGRLAIAPDHARFPLVVACCLDALAEARGQLATAAKALETTSSQLVRTLTADKSVHQAANAIRGEAGLPVLRRT